MSTPETVPIPSTASAEPAPHKRVILTMGGKGGVGKTNFILSVAEWLEANEVPFKLLDLDTENKARGSLKHYFHGAAEKIDIHTDAGLDAFIDYLEGGPPIVLADMGSGSGGVTYEWFNTMYESARDLGIGFTAIGIVTPDPASVESVLNWARQLQRRVEYIIVENAIVKKPNFDYWRNSEQAEEFRRVFQHGTIRMGYRLPELENAARQHGKTLGEVAKRQGTVAELQTASLVARAQALQRDLFREIEKVKDLLLP